MTRQNGTCCHAEFGAACSNENNADCCFHGSAQGWCSVVSKTCMHGYSSIWAISQNAYATTAYSTIQDRYNERTVGSQSLMDVTTWLSTHHVRGFLGEFGAAFNPTCMSAVDDMLTFIDQNRDVWAGWTWWSAGPWWGSYPYSIEPTNGQDAPQLATLLPHI